MATENTIGKRNLRVCGVMYELPIPVADEIERLQGELEDQIDLNSARDEWLDEYPEKILRGSPFDDSDHDDHGN